MVYFLRKYHSKDSERLDSNPLKNAWLKNSTILNEIEVMSDEEFDRIVTTPTEFDRSEIDRSK
ncbi:MAG: hypothetical protein WB511_01620 [Nitrososphaeraceae archaeon]